MRVAAGDGITSDPMSPYCTHYPGSGFAKILSDESKAHVDMIGMALLYRDDPGRFIPYVGMATHGIGTTLEYVRVHEDGTTEPQSALEYTGYGMHRGRDVLVVAFDPNPYDWPCSTAYWDLATGNRSACLDADGNVDSEWIPHGGQFEFPMAEGMREPWVYAYQRDGDEDCDEPCEGVAETWTVEECGIELEVAAGTFTCVASPPPPTGTTPSCGSSGTTLKSTDRQDPYDDTWTDLIVVELSAFDLVE